jgi:hypothetical protein
VFDKSLTTEGNALAVESKAGIPTSTVFASVASTQQAANEQTQMFSSARVLQVAYMRQLHATFALARAILDSKVQLLCCSFCRLQTALAYACT